MKIAVRDTELFIRNLSLRVPFRYGIATMTVVPHLMVRTTVEFDGQSQHGFAADNLPPKWFTKNPGTSFAEEIEEMLRVTEHAAELARSLPEAGSVFELWQSMAHDQTRWAEQQAIPPLLANFGVSLIERALIDAFCRNSGRPFFQVVHDNQLGVVLGEIHEELAGAQPAEFLPASAARTIIARHTVGLIDPLKAGDVAGADQVADGLPHTLEEFIETQGLTHFKIKLSGDVDADRLRLRRIAQVVGKYSPECAFTLDGNENFRTVAPFRALWEELTSDSELSSFLRGLIFVEQPFHRDVALEEATGAALLDWPGRPPIIIDESDAHMDSMRVALASGYVGSSHKNCKGIIHGLANACLIAHRRKSADRFLHLSGEDLTNLGPVALLQDLAAVACLGISHVERNGHHYFAGLSQFPVSMQSEILRCHGDLYERSAEGFPTVRIQRGVMDIGSVVEAPFGTAFEPDLTEFTRREQWRPESLGVCATG